MSGQVLGLFVPSITLILAVTFVGLWLRSRDDRYVLAFAGTYLLVCTGFLVFHYVAEPTNIPMMLLVHGCYSLASLLMFWGMFKRVGRDAPLLLYAAIEFGVGCMMVISIAGDDMRVWLYSANLGHGLIFCLAAQEMLRAGVRANIDRMIGWLVGISGAMFLLRPVLSMMVQERMTVAVYKSSDYYALLMVFVGVLTLALAMSLLAAVLQDRMAAIEESSENDHLTGLKLRKSFEGAAIDLLDRGSEEQVAVSMIVADIDYFKKVNDIWGHQAGDQAIAAFGKLINRTVRSDDVCGRIGGEEFCLMVWNCNLDAAEKLAERIRKAFANTAHEGISSDVRLTASFGVASQRNGEGFGKLFARADAALYRAKEAGRNKVVADRRNQKREPAPVPAKVA